MRIFILSLFIFNLSLSGKSQNPDSVIIKSIFDEALLHGQCYSNLDYLSNQIGSRLSGSANAEKAVAWTALALKKAGADSVWLEPCMVPRWVRGESEIAWVGSKNLSGKQNVRICALGGSVSTGKKGITAGVVEVKSLDEVARLGKEKIEGKIVFYNRPMDATNYNTFRAYGGAVDQRSRGAMEAAKYGALGVVVRSMTLALDDHPHTGAMRYVDSIPKIPACAISTQGAEMMSRLLARDPELKFHFRMTCETLDSVMSHNVVGEIRGAKIPNEIITVGGHLDSWDLGSGAHDDGAGTMQSIEVLRIFKALNIRPDRSIRAVMFMNEENGLRGGHAYADSAAMKPEIHLAAIESDAGGFAPIGFGIDATGDTLKKFLGWGSLFVPWGLRDFHQGGGGADIGPLRDLKQGTVLIGLNPESQRYFDCHHAETDVFSAVNKRELELGAAAMAALVYLISQQGVKGL